MDVKILIQTVKILFDKVSSRGVEDDETPTDQVRLPEGVKHLS